MSGGIGLESIPHRPPFLFVDEVLEVSADRIVARKFVDPGLDFFRGHYPGHPIMPGVLLCESCFQAGALLVAHRLGTGGLGGGVPVVTRIQDARFRRVVRPGDTLTITAEVDDVLDNAYYLTGRVNIGEALAVRLSFACMMVDPEEGLR